MIRKHDNHQNHHVMQHDAAKAHVDCDARVGWQPVLQEPGHDLAALALPLRASGLVEQVPTMRCRHELINQSQNQSSCDLSPAQTIPRNQHARQPLPLLGSPGNHNASDAWRIHVLQTSRAAMGPAGRQASTWSIEARCLEQVGASTHPSQRFSRQCKRQNECTQPSCSNPN